MNRSNAPKQKRYVHGIQARDLYRLKYPNRPARSPSPEPRLPQKHALNPPIVTIFGAGVSGLTAAHELVERGFVVQVIEAKEDHFYPGRPLVGGMAANQPARVRGNIEDLHRELMDSALSDPKAAAEEAEHKARETGEDAQTKRRDAIEEAERKQRVASWLLSLFSFNRSRWIQTETPPCVHTQLIQMPYENTERKPTAFARSVAKDLAAMREQYRIRWCWDLIMRGIELETIRTNLSYEEVAKSGYGSLVKADKPLEMAKWLLKIGDPKDLYPKRPLPTELETEKTLIQSAFEREFLRFRLVAYGLRGYEQSDVREYASALLEAWGAYLREELGDSCIQVKPGQERFAIEIGDAPEGLDKRAWLQIEFIEQRLPGEHGYRFFPSFYRHLDDTMKRTPLFDGDRPTGHTVYDNLVPTVTQTIGFQRKDLEPAHSYDDSEPPVKKQKPSGDDPITVQVSRRRPDSLEGLRDQTDRLVRRLGGTARDSVLLTSKLLRYMMTSPERRRAELESKDWGTFIDKPSFSKPIQEHIASAAQALLAFSESEADARTYGNVAIQLLLDGLSDGQRVDRTLNGPTSDAWLEPWRDYLERQGVRFFHLKLHALELAKIDDQLELIPKICKLNRGSDKPPTPDDFDLKDVVSQSGHPLLTHTQLHAGVRPDFYVLALDLAQAADLIANAGLDPRTAKQLCEIPAFQAQAKNLHALKDMTGVQFFFDAKTSIGTGHMYFPFSTWGLSSISQSEFWSRRRGFSDGFFGVLSVDICTTSSFETPADHSFWAVAKAARQRRASILGDVSVFAGEPETGFDLARGVWNQLKPVIGTGDELAPPRYFHLDTNISAECGNSTPFLASKVGLDRVRPGRDKADSAVGADEIKYDLGYNRWVACGTFMATHTRMTTMEAANESARHAVRTILSKLSEPDAVDPNKLDWKPGVEVKVESLYNKTYNGAYARRPFDLPDLWPLEERELPDLDFFRRVDRRLHKLGLAHFLDIIDFDRKLVHALETVELYGSSDKPFELLASALAASDAALTKAFGTGYVAEADTRAREYAARLDANAQALPDGADLKPLLDRVAKLLRTF